MIIIEVWSIREHNLSNLSKLSRSFDIWIFNVTWNITLETLSLALCAYTTTESVFLEKLSLDLSCYILVELVSYRREKMGSLDHLLQWLPREA